MAKEDNIRGIDRIEFGVPGDGVMGAGTFTVFKNVKLNSTNLTDQKPTTKKIPTENHANYRTVSEGAEPLKLTISLYEVEKENAVFLAGGTYTTATKTYTAPVTPVIKHLSVRLVDVEGNKLEIPVAAVIGGRDGNLTKGDLLDFKIEIEAEAAITSAGVDNSPYQIIYAN
ncbi:MAG: hypothetical protein V3V28_09365 [Polaribacter sp.]|uniref:hypothetical protein n=1 Tax=Polaribacter sp. TaxID=1920175 RepID=UPI002F3599D0